MWSRLRSLLGRARASKHHGESRVKEKKERPRSPWKTWRNKWSWGRSRTTGEVPSQLSTITEQEQQMKNLEKLTLRLHHMTCERNELRGILANYGTKDLNNRLNFELEMLNMEHNQVMSDIQKLPMEISDALDKCQVLIEETESFTYYQGQVLREWIQLKKNVQVSRLKNRLLRKEQIELQESCEEVKRLFKEIHEKICDPCAEQHQEEDIMDERLKNLLKQKEVVPQQSGLTENLQNHFNISEMRSENLQTQLDQDTDQEDSLLQTTPEAGAKGVTATPERPEEAKEATNNLDHGNVHPGINASSSSKDTVQSSKEATYTSF